MFKKDIANEKITDTQKSLQDMQKWLRKIEQNTESVSSRLGAVEQRLSYKTQLSHPQWYTENNDEIKSEHHLKSDQRKADDKTNNINDVAEEMMYIQTIISKQNKEMNQLKKQIQHQAEEESRYQKQIQKLSSYVDTQRDDIESIRTVQSKRSLLMKVKGREIPLEISGIMGGVIAFLVALLVTFGGKEIVISPWFLSSIGIIFIASSLVRSFAIFSTVKEWFAKPSKTDQ